jgi:WD40 repeat protein/molybdopterin-guanine dinucleotide biosynthesis protein
MGKLVILDLDGDLHQGITVTLEIRQDSEFWTVPAVSSDSVPATIVQARTKGKLPPARELIEQYQHWQSLYRSLTLLFRLGDRPNPIPSGSQGTVIAACQDAAHVLSDRLNTWLAVESFRPIREQFLERISPTEAVRLILQTEEDALRRLPWHLWDILQRYPYAEVALSAPAYESLALATPARERIKILAILGNRDGIDIDADRSLLTNLPNGAETQFLVEPERQEFQHWLWDEQGWDILFFAGHSSSLGNGTTGQIELNPSDRLSLDELSFALKRAIARGLKLAIFNSCDGLGLARRLERLHIPQMIVMREPVPDPVAQAFLRHFLLGFANGQPLYTAVREAREQLQSLEHQCPCATWLPILHQNPTYPPLTWHSPISSLPPPPCPYQGLSAFQETNAAFFFGREAIAARLVNVVHHRPLVGIIGPSGSGKSSLVFAGLVPRLRQSGKWAVVSFRPGNRPLFRLAEQFIPLMESNLSETAQLVEVNHLATALQQGQLAVRDVAERLLQKLGAERLLLVADQFEELYSLCPESDRQTLLDGLLTMVEQSTNVTLVLTLRADFCEHALDYRPFAAALQQFPPELLSPMTRTELQAAIEQPAIALGIKLAEGLTERILDAVDAAPGHLPLLEFALTLLWEQSISHSKFLLTHTAYDAIGGVEQALARYAEKIYTALAPIAQQQAQRIFMQLVRPGEGTADTRRLATRTEIGEAHWPVVIHLADARLVVSRQDESTSEEIVEVAHEALIQEWQRLRQWLEADRSFRTWQEQLRGAQRQWELSQQDEDVLLRGTPLLAAEHWLRERQADLSQAERQFIQASLTRRARERTLRDRQRRHRMIGLSSGITTALFLLGIATWQWHRAEVGKTNAQLDALSASSAELFDSGKELEALMEILRAAKQLNHFLEVNPDTRTKVVASLQQVVYGVREYNRLDGHDRTIISVAFSPDGQLLASASDDTTVKLWQRDGRLIATLEGHGDRVRSVSFSPDGQLLASAGYDGTIRLWQRDGTPITVLPADNREINSIRFSPDGRILAAASADGTVKLWRRSRATFVPSTILRGHESWVLSLSFSPDGQVLASAGTDGTVNLWRPNGMLITTLVEPNSSINTVHISPDGQTLAAATKDGNVWLWNLGKDSSRPTLKLILPAHKERIWGISFSPDGQTLATASADNTVKLWHTDGTLIKILEGHSSSVFSLSYSPDGSILASGSADQTIRLWHPDRLHQNVLRGHQAHVTDVSFNIDGRTLATASQDNTVQLWRSNGTHLATLSGHQQRVNGVSFSPNGQFATASADTTLKLWSSTGQLLQTLAGQNPLLDVRFSPDGQTLAAASDDNTIKLWRRNSVGKFDQQSTQVLRGHTSWVSSVTFSPDGQILAASSDDDTVKLWRRNSRGEFSAKPYRTLQGHTSRVNQVSFSGNGQTIATASDDGYVKLWRNDGTLLATLSGHSDRVNSVAFSSDGQILASATADGTVRLWSLSGSLLKNLQGHTGGILSLQFSPDSQTLASTSEDRTVILWNLNLNELLDQGCTWLSDYLQTNKMLSEGDRHLCMDL